MEYIRDLIDFILHIDVHLNNIIAAYGTWTYLVLFLIIFCETGLIVTPFLPGDSLLFATGTFAARGSLDPMLVIVLLSVAAILGDTVNYWVGRYFGKKITARQSRLINPRHIEKTHQFYEKHGGKAIVFARFVPIVRTFAPFVAGVGEMDYRKFVFYNVTGGVLWIASFTLAGYYFGNIPAVEKNFELVIFAIIVVSFIPAVIEFMRARRQL